MLNALELTGRAATHVGEISGLGCALHADAGRALLAMREAARGAGIDVGVASGFRDFPRQVAIWTAKFKGERALLDRHGLEIEHASLDEAALIQAILLWSALPGASRHHWGSEVDVIDLACLPAGGRPRLVPQEFAPGGCFTRLDRWLADNMARFGFFRPYTTDRGGVQPEPWHLSYRPVSVPALEALSVDVLAEAIAGTDMPGRGQVLEGLQEIYARYVRAVDTP
ncbi:MAG TPA: M15 family metallopeptidase [Steroidobacteraceae bacterium]|jgi:LAS superfamily LD-carboxypeptidase LdcB